MSFAEKIESIFKKLYKKQYGEDYKLSKNDKIDDFLHQLEAKYTITDDVIITYMIFSYEYYYSLPESVKKIQLAWLLSKKTQTKFFERKIWFDKDNGLKLYNELGFDRSSFRFSNYSIKASDFLELSDSEEIQKRNNPFPNTVRGLWYCAELTTMHHPKSEICSNCKMATLCREEQKVSKKLIFTYRNKK
jgi:hypothetical protein